MATKEYLFSRFFGKIYTGLFSKLSANITWVGVMEYLERKPLIILKYCERK